MPQESEKSAIKNKISRMLAPLAVLILGLGAGAVVYTSKPPVEEEPAEIKPRSVNTIAVASSSVSTVVESQGTVEARQQVNLIPQVSGEITWVSDKFVNGGVFTEGEKILEVDARDYELAVISAEAIVADATQQLETARAQSEQAISEWDLLDRGTPTALALRKPQLAGAEARVKSAEAELLKAQLMLDRTSLRSPFNSIITAKSVDRGQYVTAGTQLAEISSSDIMEIRLSLPEREVGKLNLDAMRLQGLHVRLSAISGELQKVWQGQVVRAEGKIDPKTRNIVVVAQLQGAELIANS
jgi:RND family efflux transporter MFP subunit